MIGLAGSVLAGIGSGRLSGRMPASGAPSLTRTMAGSNEAVAVPVPRAHSTLALARDTVIVIRASGSATPSSVGVGTTLMTAALAVASVVTLASATLMPDT